MNLVSLWGGGVGLPETVALAAVAVIGYLFGQRGGERAKTPKPSDELLRAAEIASRLQAVAASLRNDLATHLTGVENFKRLIQGAGECPSEASWATLRSEADRVLEPTLKLVSQVAQAYDQIRQQSHALAGFSGDRTDPLTGLCNSRALRELIQLELAGHAAVGGQFSVAIFGLHSLEGEPAETRAEQQARVLQAAELLRPQLRDTDRLARYGLDELVVVMSQTRLYGASIFGRRARGMLTEAGLVVSSGLAQSTPGDDSGALLGRADSALYSAKAAGGGTQYLHTGGAIRVDAPRDPLPEAAVGAAEQEMEFADSERAQPEEAAAALG